MFSWEGGAIMGQDFSTSFGVHMCTSGTFEHKVFDMCLVEGCDMRLYNSEVLGAPRYVAWWSLVTMCLY